MAKYGLNRVELIGNLGDDPEVRYTDQGVMYASVSLACTERYRDREGNNSDRTEWVRVTLWRGNAEIASKYLRKGSTVFVEGRLRNSSWETPQGEKRSRIDVEGIRIIMLDSRPAQSGAPRQNPIHTPVNPQTNAPTTNPNPQQHPVSKPDSEDTSLGDDLPF
ncbi:MAG: single-stranded DNA-binding protein [Bacteroidota bacterium]